MKAKLVKNRQAGSRTLVIRTTRDETLDVGQAQWLAMGPHRYLTAFRYERTEQDTLFYYDVTGLVTLHELLRSPLPGGQYAGLLLGIHDVLAQCRVRDISVPCVQWDPAMIYMSPQGYPLFVVVPVSGLVASRHTPVKLLSLLTQDRVRLQQEQDRICQQALRTYVARENTNAGDFISFHGFLTGLLPGYVRDVQTVSAPRTSSGTLPMTTRSNAVPDQFGETVLRGEQTRLSASAADSTLVSASPTPNRMPEQPETKPSFGTVPSLPGRGRHARTTENDNGVKPGGQSVSAHDSSTASTPSVSSTTSGLHEKSVDTPSSTSRQPAVVSTGPSDGTTRFVASSQTESDSEEETMLKPSGAGLPGFTVKRLRDGRVLSIRAARATIGRSKTADLHMGGNTNVSRIHAIIEMLPDGRFSITDNKSANGTSVSGRPLAPGGSEYVASGGDFELADDTFVITRM